MPAHRLTLLSLLIALLALAGCARDGSNSPRAKATREGILRLANGGEPPSLDPHLNTAVNGAIVISSLIEGLIAYHPSNDNLPEPGVAVSWTQTDQRIWDFQLREDARWSNGDPVTAHDFVYAYQRILTPELGAPYAELLFILKNAKAFNQGELKSFFQVGVEAVNDHHLRIELEGSTPYFLNLLKHHAWHPVHPPTIEAAGGMAKPDSTWTRDNYVGNGPFMLQEWTLNQIIAVRKNPFYWDADAVRLNGIDFLAIDDLDTDDRAFNSGGHHYVNTVPANLVPVYQKEHDPYLRMEPWIATYFYRINVTDPRLADKRLRQALSLAINRRAIVKRVLKGGQEPALSITPPGLAGYQPPLTEPFNPNLARQRLAEAGYADGKDLGPITLFFNTSDQHKAIAEAVAEMWKNILGLDIRLKNEDWKSYLESIKQLDYQIGRAAWIGDYAYPDTFLSMFRTGEGNNNTGWSSLAYDESINQSYLEPDPEKRLQRLHDAEAVLMDELPVIPIYHYTRIYRIHTDVKNWHPKLLDNRNFKYIYLESNATPEP